MRAKVAKLTNNYTLWSKQSHEQVTGLTVSAIVTKLKELKEEQKEFRKVLTAVAVQNTRLDNQGSQLALLAQTVEGLRRGEGLIMVPTPRETGG